MTSLQSRRGIVCVHGTWGADFDDPKPDKWWEPGSPFCDYLFAQGFDPIVCEPFIWSGNLEGTSGFWPWNWFRSPERRTWKAGARALRYLLSSVPFEHRNVIAHSHGGQLVFYLAATGFKMRRLITVGTPVRADVPVGAARPNIERWLHLYSADDGVQVKGSLGDRRVGAGRIFRDADINSQMPGGHSDVLNRSELYEQWRAKGWLQFLADVEMPDAA